MHKAVVYIVDDNDGVRESLRWLIESVGYEVVCFDGANSFLEKFDGSTNCCLVLDVRMPQLTGPELQDTLVKKGYKVPIIFITGHGDVSVAVRAMKGGAVDFLPKPTNGQLLLEAINRAIRQDIVRREKEQRCSKVLLNEKLLTAREREVMYLVVQGKLTKTIADMLGLSQRTVEMHRANIMRKMGAHNQVELTYMILSNGLLPEEELEAIV